MVPVTAVLQATWEPLHGQKTDTIASNFSSGRLHQKPPAPGGSEENDSVGIRFRLKEAFSMTISLVGLAECLMHPPVP